MCVLTYRALVFMVRFSCLHPFVSFFFNDTATTEIYTLSLHDALPISFRIRRGRIRASAYARGHVGFLLACLDRKSTRLNSSHLGISYAVFCLKKKKKKQHNSTMCRDKRNTTPYK